MDTLEQEVKAIKEIAIRLTWSMRGGIQYNDFLNLSKFERDEIATLAKENIELSKNSGLPFF